MTDPLDSRLKVDPRLKAVERRLEQASRVEPSPALRQRVITAVDDVLNEKKVPATKFGEARQSPAPFYPDLVAGTFIAAGLVLAVSVMVSVLAMRQIRPLTLSERMRIACVPDDGLLVAMAVSSVIPDAAALPFDAKDAPQGATGVRVIDARRVLEEML
jgi:hypothetical protein